MCTTWSSWRRSLACESDQHEVHRPKKVREPKNQNFAFQDANWLYKSGCTRSFANLKDAIQSGRRVQTERRSVDDSQSSENSSHGKLGSGDYVNNCYLERRHTATLSKPRSFASEGRPGRKFGSCYDCKVVQNQAASFVAYRGLLNADGSIPHFARSLCQRCGEIFARYEELEQHHLLKHAVTQLNGGDSARNIIEIIFRTSWLKCEMHSLKICRILKVQNMQKTIARFEEYRDMVKLKASRVLKRHPRCVADGNELLRFHGTTLACSLGMEGSSSVCSMVHCNVCKIIRRGFSIRKESGKGIYTAATSGKAHASVNLIEDLSNANRAMVVCRVIAGRVHKAHDSEEAVFPPSGFDSVAGKAGAYSSLDELYVFNPKAILPCFIVIYRC